MTLPKVISRYLLMIAAMMSVPPVLPLALLVFLFPPEGGSRAAAERCSDDACHERLVLKKGDAGGQLLDNGKEESQGKYSENGFNTEL